MDNPLKQIVAAQKRGDGIGVYAACTVNSYAIEATLLQALADGAPALIEATSNQVNQFDGYSGMNPAQFVDYVQGIAESVGFPSKRLLLGGDHLGPNPWQYEQATKAMAKAGELVEAYVSAGFTKIHLDASMHLGSDPETTGLPLDPAIIARRTADLCDVVERTHTDRLGGLEAPVYIIGSDVPTPGGAHGELGDITVTPVKAVEETIALNQEMFLKRGLESAWNRVLGIVVQPGVEFGDFVVKPYDRENAKDLAQFIETNDQLIYEAHSTDYQTAQTLRQMVEDHFAILKVGPWLTFAFREAVFALAFVETEWLGRKKGVVLSRIRHTLEKVMLDQPEDWQKHYCGDEAQLEYARKYSHSDRVRYYWPRQKVAQALERLLGNLSSNPIPLTLLSQVLPAQYKSVREGRLDNTPTELIRDKIKEVTGTYSNACQFHNLE